MMVSNKLESRLMAFAMVFIEVNEIPVKSAIEILPLKKFRLLMQFNASFLFEFSMGVPNKRIEYKARFRPYIFLNGEINHR